jgi:thymidylate synthase ThyX
MTIALDKFDVLVERDYIAPNGKRLLTFIITFPRIILAEFNTHRAISRNSASSRAIPSPKLMERVEHHPFIPRFTQNRKGMTGTEVFADTPQAVMEWKVARHLQSALELTQWLNEQGVHKQHANRYLEPFMWHTVIATGTEWANFFALRVSEHAQPEFHKIASMMKEAMEARFPERVPEGFISMPFVTEAERKQHGPVVMSRVSVARCARVSYLNFNGAQDMEDDLRLFNQLKQNGHWSPFEHVCTALGESDGYVASGNIFGWRQLRKEMIGEVIQ